MSFLNSTIYAQGLKVIKLSEEYIKNLIIQFAVPLFTLLRLHSPIEQLTPVDYIRNLARVTISNYLGKAVPALIKHHTKRHTQERIKAPWY